MNESTDKWRHEAIEHSLNELKEVLKNGSPININIVKRLPGSRLYLGDSIIVVSTITQGLKKFAQLHMLPEPIFVYNTNLEDFGSTVSTSYPLSRFTSVNSFFNSGSQGDDTILSYTFHKNLSLLNVDCPTNLSPIQKIPGHPLFDNFDRNKVEKKKQELISPSPIVVIAQTGSETFKRWTAQQILELVDKAKGIKNAKIYILSDAKIKHDTKTLKALQPLASDATVEIVYFESIEDICAYAGVADYFLSTDSGPAWIWGSEKKPESVALIHHIAASDFWKVPGAEIVLSRAIKRAKQENLLESNGMLGSNSKKLKKMKKIYNTLSGVKNSNEDIVPEDFKTYLSSVDALFYSKNQTE